MFQSKCMKGAKYMDQENINVDEGKYAIHVKTMKKDKDEDSAMAAYLSQVAIVNNQDNLLTVALLLQKQDIIVGFQIKNKSGEYIQAKDQQINHETEQRMEAFELTSLPTVLDARVQYEVTQKDGTFKGDESLRLVFAEDSLEKID